MNKNIYKIIEILNKDGVVVLPTDTVYGLCASFESIKAYQKILAIKGREIKKFLPVFVHCMRKAKELAYINKEQEQILNVFWPGSVTCVLKSKVKDLNTIAIRIPDDKLLLKILLEFKKPLWQTSANLTGLNPAKNVDEIQKQLKNNFVKPDLIIDGGELPKNLSSTIVDLTKKPYRILRRGKSSILVQKTLERISA